MKVCELFFLYPPNQIDDEEEEPQEAPEEQIRIEEKTPSRYV